jgi:hypothetical protein
VFPIPKTGWGFDVTQLEKNITSSWGFSSPVAAVETFMSIQLNP